MCKFINKNIFWVSFLKYHLDQVHQVYQGGVVPGKEIRVVKAGDWEVEACGGIHVKKNRWWIQGDIMGLHCFQ
jgi:hypothetical protein